MDWMLRGSLLAVVVTAVGCASATGPQPRSEVDGGNVVLDAGSTRVDGGSVDGGSARDGGSAALWTLDPAPNPLTVAPVPESGAGVTAEIPVDGGTLTATGVDGTRYELTIPPDALYSPTVIAMTPVQLPAQPFGGGPAWGVQLLPEGLVFNAPLRLVITPPAGQTPPTDQQVPFGWSSDNVVSLAFRDPSDPRLTLQLLHFSSYAYATANSGISASLAGVRARIGGTAAARLESAAADVIIAEHRRQTAGDSSGVFETREAIGALFDAYDAQVVKPRIAAAGSSCAAGRLALETLIGVERQLELLGIAEKYGYAKALFDLFEPVASVCLDEEWGLCKNEHIVQRLIPVRLGLSRQAQLLGIASGAWEAKADDYIYRCHQYRLDVTTEGGSVVSSWSFREQMEGAIQLKKESADFSSPIVSQPPFETLTSRSYDMHWSNPCSVVENVVQRDASFHVTGLTFVTRTDPRLPGRGEIADFKLTYAPLPAGGTANPALLGSEHDQVNRCAIPPAATHETAFCWYPQYFIVFTGNPEYFNTTDGWYFEQWTVNNGSAVLAEKFANATYADPRGISYAAPTRLVLNHTPAQ
jgi:hypothetical protein